MYTFCLFRPWKTAVTGHSVLQGPRKLNRTGWAKLEKQVCSLELSILYLFIPLTLMTSLIIYTFNVLSVLSDSNFPKILGLLLSLSCPSKIWVGKCPPSSAAPERYNFKSKVGFNNNSFLLTIQHPKGQSIIKPEVI